MQPRPLPPILRSDSFSVSAAQRAGVPTHRLRRSDLRAPFRGVRLPAERTPTDIVALCRAYRPLMPPEALFSHGTAARLLELPVPRRITADPSIDVAVIAPARAPRMRGVRGHLLNTAPESRSIRGLAVPHPAEVWCQLGRLLSVDELVIVGDALLRRTDPLTDPCDVRKAVDRAGSRPGVRRLRESFELVRVRTDSPMETRLRLAIVRGGLPEPCVNYSIAGRDRWYHLDLAYPHRRVAVEYDGDHHRTDRAQYRLDVDRLWQIEALGWHVVRINSSHLADGGREALRRIRIALAFS